ncbi:MarR family transcriptional regulator [Ruminococcaceae bacterium BL-6]|nr:MarR family transcriptional regulator [Ruminococcaceae bacterium BL-6]
MAHIHNAVYRAFHAQRNKLRPGMEQIGLSPGQPKILRYLFQRENCMQKDIAEALDIRPATVSSLLDNMGRAGLIQRSDAATRRRAESISITEKGRQSFEKWQRLCDEVEEESLAGFTGEEQERFFGYLCRMYQNLTGKILE